MPWRQMTDQEMLALLQRAPVGHLGLSKDGQPYVVPLHFVYQDGSIYLHSKRGGCKLAWIQANPRVCFEVEEFISIIEAPSACDYSTECSSVVIQGHARLVEDEAEKRGVLAGLVQKYAPAVAGQPLSDADVARTQVVEIVIEEMSGKARSRQ
ncbi:MAG: pyridoxamine 5'-phosphate oxidase family protein [Chloroflexi bacterium]|nr:pyridoxamine 5'-phosphate oxidase family protein [Chloroflexota bacterium]